MPRSPFVPFPFLIFLGILFWPLWQKERKGGGQEGTFLTVHRQRCSILRIMI